MWGLIVNRSRDLVRQGLGYIPDSQPELQVMLCRWTVAYRWVRQSIHQHHAHVLMFQAQPVLVCKLNAANLLPSPEP
jgi:hypothetical protein